MVAAAMNEPKPDPAIMAAFAQLAAADRGELELSTWERWRLRRIWQRAAFRVNRARSRYLHRVKTGIDGRFAVQQRIAARAIASWTPEQREQLAQHLGLNADSDASTLAAFALRGAVFGRRGFPAARWHLPSLVGLLQLLLATAAVPAACTESSGHPEPPRLLQRLTDYRCSASLTATA